ncbi:MAG: hypothetical protein KC416_09940 [Myxococcales bacterium]|nr:hypothetical protein [Myxococcales bacterium]
MPLPVCLALAVIGGFLASRASAGELRISPRPPILTRGFAALMIYQGLVLVPITLYFYSFHGDWFVLYSVDTKDIPSAVALLGVLLESALGAAAFVAGAHLIRRRLDYLPVVLGTLVLLGVAAFLAVKLPTLRVVGSFAQYHGQFGLRPFGAGPLLQGGLVLGTLLLAGLFLLLSRLHYSSPK